MMLQPGIPSEAGLDGHITHQLGEILERSIGDGADSVAPSAVAVVARNGVLGFHRAYGHAALDTVFDLASLTKAAATAVALMMLVEERSIGLDERLAHWLPEWSGAAKESVTLRQVLAHRAGLWEWRPIYVHAVEPVTAIDFVARAELRRAPGAGRHYSDLGLMLGGEVVRRVSGGSLSSYLRTNVYEPLGMASTRFCPPRSWRSRIAVTSHGDRIERRMVASGDPYPVPEAGARFAGWRRRVLVGEVNDGNAYHAFAGEAGHSGLFGTAQDLARLGRALTHGELVSADTLSDFTSDHFDVGQGLIYRTRRLGGAACFGHPGFTGTQWLVCPQLDLVVVLLTNRLHVQGVPRSIDVLWEAMLRVIAAAVAG
jgi:serine-type D-Ala-D-Ala carboxypeptidase